MIFLSITSQVGKYLKEIKIDISQEVQKRRQSLLLSPAKNKFKFKIGTTDA